ncbi:carboxypeptidase-like regulatory domain-containing protein [uncultured Imperialibacter sp.]|uniref:carboxypeptidase-like regulatory domain-containing protein n=1 Tax=uncultured Imperialibacter sp. TaxID=1672639 RepID=UPI0030DC9A67|tara:strand:+ start:7944 stop:9173 length:1230 start_codon:yes stop_codon:yes gene_type:complete
MIRIAILFPFLLLTLSLRAQKIKSPKERVEQLYHGLAEGGLSDRQVHWTFGFADADSAHLDFIASVLLPHFKQPIKRVMAAGNTFFPDETRLVIDVVDYGYYEKTELTQLVSSLTKALKKSSTDLTVLGYEVIDPQNVQADFKLVSDQPNWLDIAGVIIDVKTNEPIPGATVSFPATNEQLTSDANGQFTTRINRTTTDSVVVSALGYRSTGLSVANWNGVERIALKERYTRLDNVLVEERSLGKKVVLGQKHPGWFGPAAFIGGKFGEAAKQMEVKGGTLFINKIVFHLVNYSGRPFEFLLDVYDMGADGGPGPSLLSSKVSVLGSEKGGWVEVNMSSYNIVVNRTFFVALQWTVEVSDLNTPETEKPAQISLKGDFAYHRKNQEAQWEKSDFFAWVMKAECTVFDKK